jgi:acyl carrier protein
MTLPHSARDGEPVERAVRAEIYRVLQTQGKGIERVSLADSLSEALGLSSLDLLELVVALNERLGADPFHERAVTEVRTVADLVDAYVGGRGDGDSDEVLAASRRRAAARRWGGTS